MAKATNFRLAALLIAVFTRICSGIPTVAGCFNSTTPLVKQDSSESNSIANCNDNCIATTNNQLVLAVSGTECWCGNVLPSASSKVNSIYCDTPCPGDSDYKCGGGGQIFSVWLTEDGTDAGNIPNYTGPSSTKSTASSTKTSTKSTASSAKTSTASTRTQNNNTPTGTQNNNTPTGTQNKNTPTGTQNNNSPTGTQNNNSPTTSASSSSPAATREGQQSGDNAKDSSQRHGDADIAIAVGVVIGVVALALLAFIFWWVWRRRRQTGSFSRYQDSVDGSDAGLQSGLWKRGPSPESSTNGPEMMVADRTGPSIMVQRPTPGPGSPTDSVYSRSIAGVATPAAIAAPAALAGEREHTLRPPVARDVSRVSSTADPFYTPLEQPSISHLNQSELNALRAQTPHDSVSSSDFDEDSDTLSPLEDIRSPVPQRNNSRNIPYAYSSEYDFADGDTGSLASPMMPGNMPGHFPVGRNWGGRMELP